MSCTELVAHRLPTPTDQTVVTSNQAARWRWCSHTQRSEEPYISVRKEGHEFRNNLVRQGTLHSC
jgi:hypothetical protein